MAETPWIIGAVFASRRGQDRNTSSSDRCEKSIWGDDDMFGAGDVAPTLAVKDLAVARKFYEGALGFSPEQSEQQGVVGYKTGGTKLLVYESQFAGTNKATAVTWFLGKIMEEEAGRLKEKGIVFEHYDFPDTVLRGDIHITGDLKAAWFKDPDGNIHSIINR